MERTLGGDRLGTGNKQKVYMHGYERSTHDLSYVWRSTLASGTLVPFLTEVALPGDTFDIDLSCLMHTHPTVGPLFGSYKIQLDLFQIPIRLYQGKLHMNMLGIGMDMSQIKLPQIVVAGRPIDRNNIIDNQQINSSCLLSYLNIRGVGDRVADTQRYVIRKFNAIPYLAYWDIYKNYYANKQEEIGYMISTDKTQITPTLTSATIKNSNPEITLTINPVPPYTYQDATLDADSYIEITGTNIRADFDPKRLWLITKNDWTGVTDVPLPATALWTNWTINDTLGTIVGTGWTGIGMFPKGFGGITAIGTLDENVDKIPQMKQFPLSNIDDMRINILTSSDSATAFEINGQSPSPYGEVLSYTDDGTTLTRIGALFNQEGLGVKTYQSDLFNNWISTEWIDGVDGISAITAIDTSDGNFTIDELNLSRKIYDMLNRIAVSGGSYDDWLDAVYTHERTRSAENPMYMGGLIKELVFEEVVSFAEGGAVDGSQQPLGTLAGKGTMGGQHKGGKTIIKVDEPSYIMGIMSLTPRIDYSQGNKWDTNLKTMNDFHKPALDEIGFQDLITDQMAWFDTKVANDGTLTLKSAGKQPAWINYMTNVNQVRGNFANQNEQMFMVLNRRYEPAADGTTGVKIKDLTTYIDPSKFNHIFANTRLDAQNFWAQVGVKITARRKMSAKLIPNL